jgi:D-tyrosyl-tRNA(Tyr) deacylase
MAAVARSCVMGGRYYHPSDRGQHAGVACNIRVAAWLRGSRPPVKSACYRGPVRAVIQRVSRAKVTVGEELTGEIARGLLVLLGAGAGDGPTEVDYMIDKIVNLRIFPDEAGKMNRSVLEISGGVLAVSQFTLHGDARKGRRPAFTSALEPVAAEALYDRFVAGLGTAGVAQVATGRFGAMMDVELVNDGPVTILLDSTRLF